MSACGDLAHAVTAAIHRSLDVSGVLHFGI
jgi:hypothetical protein